MRYRLVHGGRDIVIGRGGAVIGRSAACKVQLDSEDVSRRHARLVVDGAVARIEDLGSANGVVVNGRPVVEPVVLSDGDRIDIAGHELVFVVEDAFVSATPRAPALDALWDDEEAVSFDDGKETRLTSGGSMLAAALAILRKGDVAAAASMATERLSQLLGATRAGSPLDAEIGLEASTLAVELAVALQEAEWLGYLLDLHAAAGRPLPWSIVERLEERPLGPLDRARVEAYVDQLPEDERTAELRRHLDALSR